MALNIFPRRETKPVPAAEPEVTLPEPSQEAIDDAEARKRPSRRGSRGGRNRTRPTELQDGDLHVADEVAEPVAVEETAAPAPRKRGSRSKAALAAAAELELAAASNQPLEGDAANEAEPAPAPRSRRSRAAAPAPIEVAAPDENGASPTPAPAQRAAAPARGDATTASILKAIEQQGRQIEQLVRLQEDMARRGGGGHAAAAAPPARVGIFVDSANVELACDRLRVRFDWRKILAMLTDHRQLVRAIAYSPVHDDPTVSIETQRFVEPFLDRGYKVVTKPLKRFADGSIKANVDIELALDVLEMLDRLDVVVLVSGDGDFQRLVEVVQAKGVRVEVAAVGSSTATNLRHAADHFVDLQGRVREIRI